MIKYMNKLPPIFTVNTWLPKGFTNVKATTIGLFLNLLI
ncbi:Putative uncharacterized protein [Moritella viscosa]|nr:Putative uncharacterized protein [Moritella viscosa]SHO02985.1 Putative uncharacterized protein [Moritella viscosa]SHO20873.1 Putative uncharacterized protein [Moritella viscosa]